MLGANHDAQTFTRKNLIEDIPHTKRQKKQGREWCSLPRVVSKEKNVVLPVNEYKLPA